MRELMTEKDMLHDLTTIVRDVLDDDSIVLTPETSAEDIDGWDSFKHITIVVAAESHFHVKFQTAEIESLHNIGDFMSLVSKKLATPA
jgi:acyl carrier protein